MTQSLKVKDIGHAHSFRQEGVAAIGRHIFQEAAQHNPARIEALAEKLNVSVEALTVGTDTDVFTTAISGFIEKRLRPRLVANNVIKTIVEDRPGYNSLKIPIRSALASAGDLPDNGSFTDDTGGYDGDAVTITQTYKYASQTVTHELLRFGNVDLLAEELAEIGDALARKQDSDIIAALNAAGTAGNSNDTDLGSGTNASYTAILGGYTSLLDQDATPTDVIISPTQLDYLLTEDGPFRDAWLRAMNTNQGSADIFLPVQNVMGMNWHVTTQCGDTEIYFIDRNKLGYLVTRGGVEAVDGRVSGSAAYEVAGLLAYGVGIIQPKAIHVVRPDTAA